HHPSRAHFFHRGQPDHPAKLHLGHHALHGSILRRLSRRNRHVRWYLVDQRALYPTMGSKSHRCSRCPPAITYYDPGFWLWCGRQWRIGPVGTSTNRYPIYCAPDRAGTDHYPYGTCPRNRRRHCGTATTTALLGTSATHPFSQTPRLSDQNRHRSTLGL